MTKKAAKLIYEKTNNKKDDLPKPFQPVNSKLNITEESIQEAKILRPGTTSLSTGQADFSLVTEPIAEMERLRSGQVKGLRNPQPPQTNCPT